MEKSKWIKGPDFLKEPVESWLKEETYEEHVDPDSPEVKIVKVNTSAVKESSDILKRLERFSSWFKAKMAVAFCLKYLRDRVLAKRKVSSDVASEKGPAGPNDVNSTGSQVNVTDLQYRSKVSYHLSSRFSGDRSRFSRDGSRFSRDVSRFS